jgi:PAS domain-containing protein
VDRAIEAMERLLLSRQTERLMIAFENIREGLGMYDSNERVVMMNRRYAEMYRIPPELQRPGTEFSTLLTYWREIGLLAGQQSREIRTVIDASRSGGRFQLDLLDGRTYEVNEQFLPGGGWVSTHEDITDRVAAENASFSSPNMTRSPGSSTGPPFATTCSACCRWPRRPRLPARRRHSRC